MIGRITSEMYCMCVYIHELRVLHPMIGLQRRSRAMVARGAVQQDHRCRLV